MFQHAYRMKELYFSDGGFHTVYLLNLLSGIWAFFFVREQNQYYLRGIFIEKSEVEQSWLFCEQIMEKYLFSNNRRRTGECEESYSRFISDMREELQPGNYIISTIPEEYFIKFKNIKIYTVPGMEKLKNPHNLTKKINVSYRGREICDDLYLHPPLFGKKWYFFREEGHEVIKYVCSSIGELSKEEEKLSIKDGFICDSSDFCMEAEKEIE